MTIKSHFSRTQRKAFFTKALGYCCHLCFKHFNNHSVFLIAHQNLIDFEWPLHLDRILIGIFIIIGIQFTSFGKNDYHSYYFHLFISIVIWNRFWKLWF